MAIDRALTEILRTGNGRLIVTVPPRHGKSELISKYFPAWFIGTFPTKRVILTSYEADFAASWGRKARNVVDEYGNLFPVKLVEDSTAANRWDTPQGGGMVTAGVGGPITGKGADLAIIDDPIKNYEDAHSETMRDKTWDWFTSTLYTRLEPSASIVVILTRWHEDDLSGRILERLRHESWRLIKFPAIATEADSLGRQPGDPLWSDRFDVPALKRIKDTLGSYQWSALYQQSPAPEEGGMFKRAWLSQFVDECPEFDRVVRAWDKAASERAGDFSAGVLMGTANGLYYVVDCLKGQWSAWERNKIMAQTAELDRLKYGRKYEIWLEQEPGSGGKESAQVSIRDLAGFSVFAEPSTGDKDSRARPFAAQCEAGNVRLVRGDWVQKYIDELTVFPNGTHDDQVDASAQAFNKVVLKKRVEFKWW